MNDLSSTIELPIFLNGTSKNTPNLQPKLVLIIVNVEFLLSTLEWKSLK